MFFNEFIVSYGFDVVGGPFIYESNPVDPLTRMDLSQSVSVINIESGYNNNIAVDAMTMNNRVVVDGSIEGYANFLSIPKENPLTQYSLATNLNNKEALTISNYLSSMANGEIYIADPPKIEGEIYKVHGVVQQLGNIPTHPSNVMIINRTGGALSTVAVSPDYSGKFAKLYKDLPDGTTFMLVAVWDININPYFEPVVIDRVVPTLIT